MARLDKPTVTRGLQIVQLAAQGKTDKEIASELSISTSTVKTYWTRVRHQYQAASRGEAIAKVFSEIANRHARLLETIDDGVVIMQDETIDYANAAMARLMGVANPEDLIGLTLGEMLTPEDHVEAIQSRPQLYSGERLRRTAQVRRPDGTSFIAETSATATIWEGHPAAILVVRDRTNEWRNEQRINSILAAIPDLLFVVSPEGVYLEYRASQVISPEYPAERYLGKSVLEAVQQPLADEIMVAIGKIAGGDLVATVEFMGPQGHHLCTFTPMVDGSILGMVRKIGD